MMVLDLHKELILLFSVEFEITARYVHKTHTSTGIYWVFLNLGQGGFHEDNN